MTYKELEALRQQIKENKEKSLKENRIRIAVGMATCGLAAGAQPIYDAFQAEVKKLGLSNVDVVRTGCIGVCRVEPMAEIYVPGQKKVTYVSLKPEMIPEIVEKQVVGGEIVSKYTIGAAEGTPEISCLDDTVSFRNQTRIALRNCGIIDPEDINEYIGAGGYTALPKVLSSMQPQQVIDEILAAGLRGRGGAGFPTGRKWQFTRDAVSPDGTKYLCCNADEGDPGAFMDRSVLEGDPYSVIEAMTIGAYAIGAKQGYIYIRAEYPTAVKRLNLAIAAAEKMNLLGDNILGTDHSFKLELRLGAGAFVCGEETALMHSIEGFRGEPKNRPPFPAVKGLFDKPTCLNNVETFANVCWIINNGADAFKAIGTEKSSGTKVFALGGKISNTGLIEVPMGTPLRQIVEVIGGGVPNGKKFKAAQTGGPSGGCIPASLIDTPLDFDSLGAIGSMIGSGGLIVMDEDNCMVDIAKFFLDFIVDESCGKCTPCRIGTKRLYALLEKITKGEGTLEDIDMIEELCEYIKTTALCGLGQTAPNPVLSTLRHFRNEYEDHAVNKHCAAGVCKDLAKYEIIPEACKGCTICARKCPVGAISGNVKEPHVIDQEKCIKCGVCKSECRFNAIKLG